MAETGEEFFDEFEGTYLNDFPTLTGLDEFVPDTALRRELEDFAHERPAASGNSEVAKPKYGNWSIHDILGKGGMGRVYKAGRELGFGSIAEPIIQVGALKIMNPKLMRKPDSAIQFMNEMKHLNRLESPFVASFLDAGIDESAPWYASKFIPGHELAKEIKARGPLSEALWMDLAGNLLRAVRDAHRKGIVHRDIKPSNVIYMTDDRTFVLVDFGLAIVNSALGSKTIGFAEGTPFYMAPEQYEGHFDQSTDVFALGLTLLIALTGTNPAEPAGIRKNLLSDAEKFVLAVEAIRDMSIDWSSVSDNHKRFLEPMLHLDPARRPDIETCFETLLEWQETGICPTDFGDFPDDLMGADFEGFYQAPRDHLPDEYLVGEMLSRDIHFFEEIQELRAAEPSDWDGFAEELSLLFDIRGVKGSSMALVNQNGENLVMKFDRTRGYEVLVTLEGSKAVSFNSALVEAGWLRRTGNSLEMRVSGTNLNNMVSRTLALVLRTIREDLKLDLDRLKVF